MYVSLYANTVELPLKRVPNCQNNLSCEQALWGKNSKEREGKGWERACRQTFEAAIPPSCNYLAEHLSVRSLSVNQFRA